MNYHLQKLLLSSNAQRQLLSVIFFGSTNGESDRAWVDNQSSIVGTDSVDIDVKGKLGMDGSLIANIDKDGKDQGNLDIKAGSIETSDISNYDRNSESGYNINTNLGGNPQGTNDGYDSGKSHFTITDKGSEKEGITHSTIGQGNIEIADGSDISGINRDINKTETITKDQITGALDVDLTVNHSIITDGPEKLLDDISQYPDNMRDASGNLVQTGQQASDSLESGFFNDNVVKPLLGLYNAIVGAPGGVIGTFDESRSELYVNGEKVPAESVEEVLQKYQNYLVNGMLNSQNDVVELTFNDGTVVRYNPSYGAIGDGFEALMGKILSGNATTSDWLAMNRIVAGDLDTRKDLDNATNAFHSQGTIIGTGAANILDKNGISINSNQHFDAYGPAVSFDDWNSTISKLVSSSNSSYHHNTDDPIRYITTKDGLKILYDILNNPEHITHGGHGFTDGYMKKENGE